MMQFHPANFEYLPIVVSILELGRGTGQTEGQTEGQTDTAAHFIMPRSVGEFAGGQSYLLSGLLN